MSDRATAGRKYPWVPIAGFVAFAAIAFWVLRGFSQGLDRLLFLDLAEWARSSDALMRILTFVSTVAEPKFRVSGAVLLFILLLAAKRTRLALFVFAATAGGAALCSSVKALAARARPDLLTHLDSFDSYSFPSGHAWNGMIFYGEIALVMALFVSGRWRISIIGVGILLAFLTGWARIALGVHWPSDVLAGWVGGGAWLLLCYRLLVARAGTGPVPNSIVDP